ncbi:hypothetical protein BT93_F0391 [Corymbia citriodora subsp. variegata]|nr:hypothetical protein BT93_F0391 [Corymbia citriodora subsp. variegata]
MEFSPCMICDVSFFARCTCLNRSLSNLDPLARLSFIEIVPSRVLIFQSHLASMIVHAFLSQLTASAKYSSVETSFPKRALDPSSFLFCFLINC